MKLEKLSPLRLIRVYYEHLFHDFPPAERRPLYKIFRLMALDRYDFWVMRDGKELFAYGAVARVDGDVMLDYLAVCRGKRDQGHGSRMLALLEQEYAGKAIFLEAEDPDAPCSGEERQIRLDRLRFYQRAGFLDSGVRCDVYGVDFVILCKGPGMNAREAQRRLDRIYRAVFTPKAYEEHIRYTGTDEV